MATKTISIDMLAYEKLVRGRSTPKESFSSVIRRAEIKSICGRAGSFLLAMEGQPLLDESSFKRWQKMVDSKPRNPWRG